MTFVEYVEDRLGFYLTNYHKEILQCYYEKAKEIGSPFIFAPVRVNGKSNRDLVITMLLAGYFKKEGLM